MSDESVNIPPLALVLVVLATAIAHAAPDLPDIPARTFDITTYGAVGDGKTLNTTALQKAIQAAAQAGGGIVRVPAGKFLTGPLSLATRIDLHLDKGATLLLTDDLAAYPREMHKGHHAPKSGIDAANATDLRLSGEGTIDGQGAAWWTAAKANPHFHRPNLVRFALCQRVEVVGVTLTNSPMFHLVPVRCTNVTIHHVAIRSPAHSPNTDGIDPSGSHIRIEDCTIDAGDDNIAIKPDKTAINNDIVVTGCAFRHGHGMSIGSGTELGVNHLTVSNCTFTHTKIGIRTKTSRGSGGLVQNATYEHLRMKDVRRPIEIVDYYPTLPASPQADPAQPVTPQTPTFANIVIDDLTATGAEIAGTIWGLPEMPISGILLRDVRIHADTGLQIVHARDLTLANVRITAATGNPLKLSDAKVRKLN